MTKYNATRTYSSLCGRMFSSKWEAERAEQLKFLELGNVIQDLWYQVRFTLSEQPRVTITIDFSYLENGVRIFEDAKGVLTRDFRTKLAWLKETQGIEVILSRRN